MRPLAVVQRAPATSSAVSRATWPTGPGGCIAVNIRPLSNLRRDRLGGVIQEYALAP